MGFLKYMDSMAMGIGIAFFLYMLFVAASVQMTHRLMYFMNATFVTTLLIFAGTRDLKLASNPYIASFGLLAATLWACGFVAAADPKRRWTPYLAAYGMIGTIAYAITAHQGALAAKTLLNPLGWVVLGPMMAVVLLAPLLGWKRAGVGLHALWIPPGVVLVSAGVYYMVEITAKRITLEADPAKSLVYTLIAAGALLFVLGFVLGRGWLLDPVTPSPRSERKTA